MELDDLKNSWEEVQAQIGKQQNINPKMIDKMTQTKYNARMNKIAYPEIIGTIVCCFGIAFIVINFGKLNTLFLQGIGLIVVLFLLVLPIISLTFLWHFNKIGDVGKPYVATLRRFAIQKIRFYRFQQISAVLSYLFLGFSVILIPKFFGGKNINDNKYLWAATIFFGYIFLFFFSRWGLKCYKKTLEQAEALLKELQPE